jgi:hypothetical protein
MHLEALKPALAVAALLSLSACQSNAVTEDPDLATSLSMLSSSVVSQGCTFTISAVARPGTLPPIYDYVVARQASMTCAYPAASTTVGSSYSPGSGITGNDLGVAVAYVTKNTPSGSSPLSVSIKQIAVGTLGTVRTSGLSCGPSIYSTYLADLFMLNGTTLQVNGTKGCKLYGWSEFGSGSHYYAYYFDFFTTTGAPVIIAY